MLQHPLPTTATITITIAKTTTKQAVLSNHAVICGVSGE